MDLTEPEKRLVSLLTEAPPACEPDFREESGMTVEEVLGVLLGLEIKGIVNQQEGKVFALA
jgi:predicted Rossmann fold nucleotide-binding protein DprA/Smf involved in DNA uptake